MTIVLRWNRVSRLWAAIVGIGLLAGCNDSGSGTKSNGTASGDANAASSTEPVEILNVSYDPTRELWKELNEKFVAHWEKSKGQKVTVKMSHGGSSSQARQVIDGLPADVVTLALWADTEAIHKAGLIADGWEEKWPNGSLPYSSTVVFVVRKGNPKQVKDWSDLVKSDLQIITPDPKTSGGGKLNLLSAWGSVVLKGGTDDAAKDFLKKLYQRVPVLDSGARGATTTFSQKGIGDVQLTWENEGHLEIAEAKGELDLVYPTIAIRAEPRVAIVDANVDRKGTRKVAEGYLEFLYTDEAQQIIAKHHYRPYKPEVLKEYEKSFPSIEQFPIKKIADSWDDANEKFFADGAIFDSIYDGQKAE